MSVYKALLSIIPEVKAPTRKNLPFKTKLLWTGIVLLLFFILSAVHLYGLGENALSQFEFLSVVLGASFGSIVSLGIGPIVTASIILQLLNGSGVFKFDLTSHEGKAKFQGTQRLLTLFFIVIEAIVYVGMGGLSPAAGVSSITLIIQLCIGGLLIVFLDDVINKWGFGSGVSLFIAAGVSQQIFIQMFSIFHPTQAGVADTSTYVGAIPQFFQSLAAGDPTTAGLMFSAIAATVVIFGVVVFAQSMKVEIPLSFGRIRGHGIRWPLNFVYTNVLPIILVSALVANIQLFSSFLGDGNWLSNIVPFLVNTNLLSHIVNGSVTTLLVIQSITYLLFFIAAATLFSWFWMQTSGLEENKK